MKGNVCEVSLGRRGGSSYGEGGRGMTSCGPATFQILGPPGIGFCHAEQIGDGNEFFFSFYTEILVWMSIFFYSINIFVQTTNSFTLLIF